MALIGSSYKGNLMTYRPSSSFRDDVALGRIAGVSSWTKFGYNSDVDTAVEVLAEFGGIYTPPSTASTLTVVSSSANDVSTTGTGARTLTVYGIDANRDSQIEVVSLNGTTNVVTTSTWLGINRVSVEVAGTLLGNDGNISITATTGGATLATMPAGQGTSQQCIFHTFSGTTSLLESIYLSGSKPAGAGTIIDFKLWVYSAVSNATYEIYRYSMDTTVETSVELRPDIPFKIGEDSVVYFEAVAGANNTEVAGRFTLTVYNN